MKLSIVIPAYNVEKYLGQCLESCFRQDLESDEYEVIVVNDGSMDATPEIALQWESSHSNMKVISQENKGLSEARNCGLAAAKGEYTMFLDSDDWIVDNCLRSLIDKCLQDKLDILRFCAARMINGSPYRMFSYKGFAETSPGKDLLKTRFFVCVPFSIYRTDFLRENGLSFYPGIYHEDNEFTPRAYYLAERVGSVDDLIYCLRQTPGSITHSVNPKKVKDLLKVSEQLMTFAEQSVTTKYRSAIYKQSADCINACFRELNRMDKRDSAILFDSIYRSRRQIFGYFLKSASIKHRIEGMLMYIFPKRMLGLNRLLDLVHYKERRRQKGIA